MWSKPSKGCCEADVTVEGPFFAAGEACSSEEEMPALGGALPTPDLRTLCKPFVEN